MTLYAVFERPSDPEPVVVPETFSWFAALLPPVYALVHGLWLGLAAFLALVVALGLAALYLGEAAFWLYVLAAILIGFEAPAFRRAKLTARGYAYRSDVIAAVEDLAQTEWLKRKPAGVVA